MKSHSHACERNREPIAAVLRQYFTAPGTVLEIGAGTGQHAAYFAAAMPHLQWWPTDREENLAGIDAWVGEASLPNLHPPRRLDVRDVSWPLPAACHVFSANTAHIMSWSEVECLFGGVARVLKAGGMFCLYGPFNRDGHFTSESNRDFDASLRARDPLMGLRDDTAVIALGVRNGLEFVADHPMPANNRLLAFRRSPRM